MNKEKLNGMSDEEKISYLEKIKDITDESDKIDIIRSLSTDDLKLQCVTFLLRDESKAATIYSMTNEDNKFKLILELTPSYAGGLGKLLVLDRVTKNPSPNMI